MSLGACWTRPVTGAPRRPRRRAGRALGSGDPSGSGLDVVAQLVALKRNKTAIKFADLEAMDESAADEVLLSKLFAALSAWKAKKFNMTKKFTADAVTADAADDGTSPLPSPRRSSH